MELEIVIATVILLALVFLATVDMAFSNISDVGLRRISSDAEESERTSTAAFLREILENRPRFRFALSSAIQFLLISFTVLLTLIILEFTSSRGMLLLLALAIGLAFTVIFRQLLPRFVVQSNPEARLMLLLPIVRPLYRIASIVVRPFAPSQRSKDRQKLDASDSPDLADERDDNDDDFQALMEVGEAEGIIEEDERKLIETVVEFSDTRAGEIMTPRTEICALSAEATVREARDRIISEKYSRLPVYRDSIDRIEGVIYVRDLLQAWSEGVEDQPISDLVRDAFFVPETKPVADLLKTMQLNHVQIAVVIDEYGGVAGLVTVEDILEELVGEIEDEDTPDEEIIEIIEGEGGYWDVLGSTEIDKIERLFQIDIEDEDFTTIAGFVTSEAGCVPKVGERITAAGLEAEILRADEKKISLLRLRRAPAKSVEEDGASI